ncbi:MAG: hypothetical protein ACI4FY_01730 [Acetatifactor sp.]
MITMSLDEYGDFEKEENRPLFIGGLIFDDGEQAGQIHTEEGIERARIRAYYKKVIEDAGEGFSYPEDLHSNGDASRDHNVVAPVKNKVAETLPEFISKGTYAGNPLYDETGRRLRDRKGRYHLFVMLKSDDGKKRLLSENANMLARDDWAANLYFHMASSVVNRIIFHNPIYRYGKAPSINIDIATRSTGDVDEMDSSLKAEFVKQGYRINEVSDGTHRFYSIMNADIYRTLIAQEMVNSGNVAVKIEKLYVKSIQYDPQKQRMEFLYLSDSLCSMLGYKLVGTGADDWLGQLVDRTNRLNPHQQNLIFGYDEIDNSFAKAWNCYERGKLYEALSIAYDAKMKQGRFAQHYREVWFPYLEERVREIVTPVVFTNCVNDLSASLSVNNLDQEKLLYLMQQFELMVDKVADQYKSIDMKAGTLFKLYDAGVSAFCHIGNAARAFEYYEKCKQYAFYVGVDAYLRTNNKMIVCLEDCFEWEKALELAVENVSSQQLASEIKREVLKRDDEDAFLDEAKANSQLARIYAEKRSEKAETYFREALQMLERGSANYKITQSYLLHYYADTNQKDAFDQEIRDYFDGRSTYHQMFRYLTSLEESVHSSFSNEYAMYVLIRGLFSFHQEEVDEVLWEKLCGLEDTLIRRDGRKPSGHPWEITYKYLELLAIKRKDFAAREKFSGWKKRCLNYRGEIVEALDMFGAAEVADYCGDIVLRDEITGELAEYLNEKFPVLREVEFSKEGMVRYQELQNYFTFMYH